MTTTSLQHRLRYNTSFHIQQQHTVARAATHHCTCSRNSLHVQQQHIIACAAATHHCRFDLARNLKQSDLNLQCLLRHICLYIWVIMVGYGKGSIPKYLLLFLHQTISCTPWNPIAEAIPMSTNRVCVFNAKKCNKYDPKPFRFINKSRVDRKTVVTQTYFETLV